MKIKQQTLKYKLKFNNINVASELHTQVVRYMKLAMFSSWANITHHHGHLQTHHMKLGSGISDRELLIRMKKCKQNIKNKMHAL
jgi:hypothetical protein